MTVTSNPTRRRTTRLASLGVLAATARWLVLHRRAPAVRGWRPGGGARRVAGGLSVRTAGDGDRVVILLHGLTASGDYFGAGYDQLADAGRLVIPDLLGFGRSLGCDRDDYSLRDHLAALDRLARELELDGRRITVGGHSLGALLALHWAAGRTDVEQVVCFSASLYADGGEADRHIAALGLVDRTYGAGGPVARVACGAMCRHRPIAEWIAVAAEPRFPVLVTRMAMRHCWGSYAGALNGVIRTGGWEAPLSALHAAGVAVLLADGVCDPLVVDGRASELAARYDNIATALHPTAGHQLPITHPAWCADRLTQMA